MTNFKLVIYCITTILLLNGCNKILEPVSLFNGKRDDESKSVQEEFEINIKSLTFNTAEKANDTPYSRRMILTGSGSKANVLDESNFLKSNLPKSSIIPQYLLGIGDQISFIQLNEFETEIAKWPKVSKETEYLLGVGDELTFAQSNDSSQDISIALGGDDDLIPKIKSDNLFATQGVIGSKGNLLLFGLGNIQTTNRTLENVRTEVRNILIRKGLAPNFQLEISGFKSKKAFVTNSNDNSQTITLNNLPITLQEIALEAGLSVSDKNLAIVKLTRNEQEFRFTADQLLDLTAPQITIQDADQIEIQTISVEATTILSTVGSKGNILLGNVGSISAVNRTVDDIYEEISSILVRKGIKPNFQLELTKFASKKAFVTNSNDKSQTITLNNLPITLKEIALEAGLSVSDKNLAIVKLTRNEQEFRFTADQLLDLTAPQITIQDADQIEIQTISVEATTILSTVGSKGNILLGNVGSISAVNRTVDDIYEEISSILVRKGIKPNFQLELTKFASKKAYLIQKNVRNIAVPLTSTPITLRELILENKRSVPSDVGLSIISLKRNKQVFRMTEDQILDPKTQDIWIIDEDQIELETLNYKLGKVFALSGAGRAQVVSIDPSKRETLADILFAEGGALNNLLAKRSEVYLLRGKNPSVAYHLDAQNVSRILVAANTELRPNDIVYVADRPIISFSRTLSEILPLRILLRDIQNDNIP